MATAPTPAPGSSHRFQWWEWASLWLFARILSAYMLLVRVTSRIDISGMDPVWAALAESQRVIFASWHQDLVVSTFLLRNRNLVTMVSASRDGEIATYIARRQGYTLVRGSTSRGGGRALIEMIRRLRRHPGTPAGLVVDGPRGPARVVKAGVVHLARATGAVVLPVRFMVRRRLELNNWDRTVIPLPFNTIVAVCGEPIPIPRDADPSEQEALRRKIEEELRRLDPSDFQVATGAVARP